MTIAVVLILLVVFLVAASVIAWPIVRGDQLPDEDPASAGDDIQRVAEDLERTLDSIKEIAFDHASGHLSDEDFSALDADERSRAIELLRERDAMTPPPTPSRGLSRGLVGCPARQPAVIRHTAYWLGRASVTYPNAVLSAGSAGHTGVRNQQVFLGRSDAIATPPDPG
jgi:hypothetical protein